MTREKLIKKEATMHRQFIASTGLKLKGQKRLRCDKFYEKHYEEFQTLMRLAKLKTL